MKRPRGSNFYGGQKLLNLEAAASYEFSNKRIAGNDRFVVKVRKVFQILKQSVCGLFRAVSRLVRIDLSASDATTYEDVKEVEFALRCVDANSYQTLSTGDPVVAFLN